jgi:hypothetical protein
MNDDEIEMECPECGAMCLVDDGSYVAISALPATPAPLSDEPVAQCPHCWEVDCLTCGIAAPPATPSDKQEAVSAEYRCRKCGDSAEIKFKYARVDTCCRKSPCEHPGEGPCHMPARRVVNCCPARPLHELDAELQQIYKCWQDSGEPMTSLFRSIYIHGKHDGKLTSPLAKSAEQDRIDAERSSQIAKELRKLERYPTSFNQTERSVVLKLAADQLDKGASK